MERGANTFPFHNLLPYSESNEGLFLYFLPSLNWIKENSVATLAIRNICDTKISKSVHRITLSLYVCKLKRFVCVWKFVNHSWHKIKVLKIRFLSINKTLSRLGFTIPFPYIFL